MDYLRYEDMKRLPDYIPAKIVRNKVYLIIHRKTGMTYSRASKRYRELLRECRVLSS